MIKLIRLLFIFTFPLPIIVTAQSIQANWHVLLPLLNILMLLEI